MSDRTLIVLESDYYKLEAQSKILNKVGYLIATVLGRVVPPNDYQGDTWKDVNDLVEVLRVINQNYLALLQQEES